MKTILTKCQFIIENDANPLLIFDNTGKIKYLNKLAEFLLGSCQPKELYDLALSHAPKSFGAKITYIDLIYKTYHFYAINILYECEEEIVIHLYQQPLPLQKEILLDGYTPTDINLLLETNLELFKMNYQGNLKLFTDYDLPKIHLNQNSFSLLLRKIFEQVQSSIKIEISMTLKLGESIHINKKRYSILILKIKTDKREIANDAQIEKLSSQNHIVPFLKSHTIVLEIPFIRVED